MKTKRLTFLVAGFSVLQLLAADPAGLRPPGADGQPLNLDFETGTLKDWTATGDAFSKQPVKGDLVAARRADSRSGHQGQFWIGGFEIMQDAGLGTLTSVPFRATLPWASFLVGGGPNEKTRVEIVLKAASGDKVIFKTSGREEENLRRAVVDLQPHQGREIFVRVVDEQQGHWGHINFDDFLFHAAKPVFPDAVAAVTAVPALPADTVKFSSLPAAQAAQEITLSKGFKATLFAGEPDIVQPVAFAIDDRGRLWVAEGMTYPKRKGVPPSPVAADGKPTPEQLADILGGNDRILVLEDTDGDGKFDRRTVFMEKLNLVSGLEIGFGGVWIGATPYLMFVPVQDGDSPKPAGDPQVLLDGWDFKADTHEVLNTFTWGPDGWLYGCHGVFCPSSVGQPGTPKAGRQWVDAAVWRYHPTKKQFEVFAEGTSNPWGIDFDANGQCFIEACVIPHLFHMIQGGKYQRQGGPHYAANADEVARISPNSGGGRTVHPFVYGELKTIADHRHYLGDKGPHAGNGRSDAVGGGHAHAGLLVYQGDSFPAEYRGQIFMNNIHGARINMDIPERAGSGFVGKHGADFASFNDRSSQILNLLTGPDGSVFMIDWYDKNQCHHGNEAGHDRNNGRIFKVTFGEAKAVKVDLQKLSDGELVRVVFNANSWHARHATRILHERASAKVLDRSVSRDLLFVLGLDVNGPARLDLPYNGQPHQKLRAMWALQSVGEFTQLQILNKSLASMLFLDSSEYVRAWTIQLACEDKKPSDALLKEFARMAREDKSPVVRLYLASALQRLPVAQRGEILEGLLAHAEDATDQNLPLMYWYAAEPLAGQDVASAAKLLAQTKIPLVREYITRRMATRAK